MEFNFEMNIFVTKNTAEKYIQKDKIWPKAFHCLSTDNCFMSIPYNYTIFQSNNSAILDNFLIKLNEKLVIV